MCTSDNPRQWLVQIPEDHAPVAQENWTPVSMYVCQFICGIVFHGNSLFKKLLCPVVDVCWKVLLGGSVLCVLWVCWILGTLELKGVPLWNLGQLPNHGGFWFYSVQSEYRLLTLIGTVPVLLSLSVGIMVCQWRFVLESQDKCSQHFCDMCGMFCPSLH